MPEEVIQAIMAKGHSREDAERIYFARKNKLRRHRFVKKEAAGKFTVEEAKAQKVKNQRAKASKKSNA